MYISAISSVSPLGNDVSDIVKNYNSSKSLLSKIDFNGDEIYAGCIPENIIKDIDNFICDYNYLKNRDKIVKYALFVTREIIDFAKDKSKTGVAFGSSRGSTETFERTYDEFAKTGYKKVELLTSPLTTLGNLSSEIASFYDTKGGDISNSMTCSTGLQALINGMAWLKAGFCEQFIVGASEAPLTNFTFAQTKALKIYNNIESEFPCRPFMKGNDKTSFILGEAAVALILSKEADANTLGKIESFGFGYENPPSLTGISEDGDCFAESMQNAISKLPPNENIDLILMHAPGTLKGDKAELTAINKIFTNKEYIPQIYSNKWLIGHTYAASGLLNLQLALLILNHGLKVDFPYPIDIENKKSDIIKRIMINATGFGGNAISIIVNK
ncbi:MAG: hypothetical protein A2X12_00200 [Bacteroidetes bacterium GWE2_29_8]|nr:MAG: hypothetical protein A2X12_00200 [Bacteroidetes bacterium GWE2_29_8]OFY15382.1 MAG: hypothetical protein A2X02_03030 [Bacteroidetes bacterium GWF2_29_10]